MADNIKNYLDFEGLQEYHNKLELKQSENLATLETRLQEQYTSADGALSQALGAEIENLKKTIPEDFYINVKAGETDIQANGKSALTLAAGGAITLTPDVANKTITISSNDTTYELANANRDGLLSSEDYKSLQGLLENTSYPPDGNTITVGSNNTLQVNKITAENIDGVLNIDQIPRAALERVTLIPESEYAEIGLETFLNTKITTKPGISGTYCAENGDSFKFLGSQPKMYMVVNSDYLWNGEEGSTGDSSKAFTEYTAATYWNNIAGKPSLVTTESFETTLKDYAKASTVDSIQSTLNNLKYAGSDTAGGSANSAKKLDTNAGNSTTPVYFKDGKPEAVSYPMHEKTTPTAGTFTKVTVNGDGHITKGFNPTTLDEYGITDAKIADGMITLGSTSITPLTFHQLVVSENSTADWGSSVTVGTVGGTPLTFKMPDEPADNNTTYTLGSGTREGTLKLTPSSGSVQDNIAVTGLKALAYKDSLTASEVSAFPLSGTDGVFMVHVDVPSYEILNNIYSTTGTSDSTYYENAIKWLANYCKTNWPGKAPIIATGDMCPNSRGWYTLQIYNPSDIQNGLPRYSSGICNNLNNVNGFGTRDYIYVYPISYTGTLYGIASGAMDYASSGTIHDHVEDTTIHITSAERVKWNNATANDLRALANTWSQKQTYSAAGSVDSSSSVGAGAINVSDGGIVASGGIKGNKVYNAVWNDLADCIPVDDGCTLEPGRCYVFDGERYTKSSKYLDDGIIGIHSDTYGMHMGSKEGVKQMDVAVAGFVLAYVDRVYRPGTPLTCGPDGTLTEILKQDKIEWPEKVVAVFWKDEPESEWGDVDNKVRVDGRKWVKVR